MSQAEQQGSPKEIWCALCAGTHSGLSPRWSGLSTRPCQLQETPLHMNSSFFNNPLVHFGRWEATFCHLEGLVEKKKMKWQDSSIWVFWQSSRCILCHQADNITRIDNAVLFCQSGDSLLTGIKKFNWGQISNMDRGKKGEKKWKEVWVRQKGHVVCELTQGESSRAYLDTERSVYFGGEGNVEDSPQGLCSLSHEARASQCCFWTNQATALCPFQHALSCLGLNGKHSGTLSPSLSLSPSLCVCVRKLAFKREFLQGDAPDFYRYAAG